MPDPLQSMTLTNAQTHNIAVVEGVASYVVSLGTNGRIANQGKWTRVLEEDAALSKELDVEREEFKTDDGDISNLSDMETRKSVASTGQGKLVAPEEISQGRVSWSTGEVKGHFLS